VAKALHEDLGIIFNFLMLTNPKVIFAMFSLCYAPWLFASFNVPSPSTLQHYAKFDIHTIVVLEKLLDVRTFGGFIGHLAHPQTTFIAFSNGLGFLFVVWIVALAFLRCWALLILALIIRFH
jgi:hypothetical protein